MNPITIGIFLVFICDMLMTYFFVRYYKFLHPRRDWTIVETNPLLKFCFRNFGLNPGIIIGSLFIFLLLVALLNYLSISMKFFICGMYTMMLIFHYVNFNALRQIKVKEVKNE